MKKIITVYSDNFMKE